MMVERSHPYLKVGIAKQHVVGHLQRGENLTPKAIAAAKLGAKHPIIRMYFVRDHDEVAGVVLDQVPGVAMQLVVDLADEIRWAIQPTPVSRPKAYAQQVIEAREMIHVRVRNEDISDAQQLAGG